MHTKGDTGRAVRQVPHDRLMRNTFGGEGDVANLLQLFAQMEMDEITCLRLVVARFHETDLDDKSITWGATGERAWGQNVLTGAAAERCNIVMAAELAIVHPKAFLQPERAINLDRDNKAATARAFVKLHNDMQHAPPRIGFSLLNHNVPPLLFQDAAFHKFNEMSTIGPWIDRQDMLQWDYVSGAGFRRARSGRNGNLRKDALIESEGYMLNDQGKLCIKGYNDLGNLRKDALNMVNNKGEWCIKGYQDLGNLTRDANIKRDGHMVDDKGVQCITKYHEMSNLAHAAKGKVHEANALGEHHSHECISAICQKGVSIKWRDGYPINCHHCYDSQQSGLAGQKPRQVKGLKLHLCKKCHRTAKECKGTGCLAPACRNYSLKSCQHLR